MLSVKNLAARVVYFSVNVLILNFTMHAPELLSLLSYTCFYILCYCMSKNK